MLNRVEGVAKQSLYLFFMKSGRCVQQALLGQIKAESITDDNTRHLGVYFVISTSGDKVRMTQITALTACAGVRTFLSGEAVNR